MTEDFYDLLEVSSDASQDEIKTAFREQVRVYHPDVNDDDRARAQFTALKTAYDILSDPVERQAYDRLGHEDYVAKRTDGLPSPDVWRTSDDADDGSDASAASSAAGGTTATGGSTSAAGGSSGATSSSRATGRSTDGSTASAAGGSATGSATAGATASKNARSTSSARTSTRGSRGTSAASTDSASGTGGYAPSGTSTHPVVRWWNRQNFSLPLLWASILTYLVGLGHFALENEAGLRAAAEAASGAGASVLTGDRYGIETPLSFVAGVDPVLPLEGVTWYAALAGLVVLALVAILVVRIRLYRLTWQRLTINETILLAAALGTATGLLGGPLLAGTVLMPFLFGVIVYRTRQLSSGWSPSYAYVVAVWAPLVGLAVHATGNGSLAVDLAAFVVVPLSGALGLPLRLFVRKRFGR